MLEQKKTRVRKAKMITDETTGEIQRWCSLGKHYVQILKFSKRTATSSDDAGMVLNVKVQFQSSCKDCLAAHARAKRVAARTQPAAL